MLKRKTLLLSAAFIAVIAVFAASEALAFNDDACYGWNYEGNASGCTEPARSYNDPVNDFTMKLVEGSPSLVGENEYLWQYQVTTPGLSFVAWFIPDCCTTPQIDLQHFSPDNLTFFDVGEGEPTVGFGMYNNTGRVLKGTPDSGTIFSFLSNTNVLTSSAAIAKVKKAGVLAFEIAVPGCFPAPEPPCVPQLAGGQSAAKFIGATLIDKDDPNNPDKQYPICIEVIDSATCNANLYAASCDNPDFRDEYINSSTTPIPVPIGDGHIVGFTGPLTGSALCDFGAIELNAGCYVVTIGGRPVAYIPTGCK